MTAPPPGRIPRKKPRIEPRAIGPALCRQSLRIMHQHHFERLARKFARFYERLEATAHRFIDFLDNTFNAALFFKYVCDDGVRLKRRKRLGFELYVHAFLSIVGPSAPAKAIHRFRGFPARFLVALGLSPVVVFFPLRQGQLAFGPAFPKIDFQRHER